MAMIWAMEDSNLPSGWYEQQELDYSAIVRKPSENRPEARQQESKLGGERGGGGGWHRHQH